MILIIAPRTDDHVIPVTAELRRRNVRHTVFDLSEIPQETRVSVSFDPDMKAIVERADPFDLSEVTTVWLRRLGTPRPPPIGDAWWSVSECHHLLVGLAQSIHDSARWVNPLGALAMDGGWGKIRQLQVAREVGLEVPRTLASNDPEKARAFVASCPAGAIYKPFASREGLGRDGVVRALFTTQVDDKLASSMDAVAHAPCVFQEKVAKQVELRVTVMGARVFATAIDSQSDPSAKIDYRHRYTSVPHAVHALPRDVEDRLLSLHERLGLIFGTSDWIVTPEGRYVFLEVNQQGQWTWAASQTKVPLVEAFCDLLTEPRPS